MRMEIEDGQTKPKRIALNATTLDQAKTELEKARTENRAGKLALPGRRPCFSEFAEEYLASATHEQKGASTRRAERVILGYWKSHLGSVALDKITPVMVKAYRERRLGESVKARTVNIETVTCRPRSDRFVSACVPTQAEATAHPPIVEPARGEAPFAPLYT